MKFLRIISLSVLLEHTSSSANLTRGINLQRRVFYSGGQHHQSAAYELLDEVENYEDPNEQVPGYAVTDPHLEQIEGEYSYAQVGQSSTSNQASAGSSAGNFYYTTWPEYKTTAVFMQEGGDTVHLIIGNDAPNIKKAWREQNGESLSRAFVKVHNNVRNGQTQGWRNAAFALMQGSRAHASYQESIKYLPLAKTAKRLAESENKKLLVVYKQGNEKFGIKVKPKNMPGRKKRDLVSKGIAARSSGPETSVKPVMLKDYTVMNKSGSARLGQMATLIDVSSTSTAHKRALSMNTLQQLSTPTKNSSQDSTTSGDSLFLEAFAAFQAVQANISNAIFPILTDMTSKTNSSLIFQAALSIWVDLTAPNMVFVGPFLQGFSCMDQLEAAQAKEMNISVNSPDFDSYRAVSAILVDVYEDAWNRSYAAANKTGLLDRLDALGSYLTANSNSTNVPAFFTQVQNNTFDVSFFNDYDRNGDLDRFLA